MGFIQKDALRTMILNYLGIMLGYLNKGVLFLFIFQPEEYGLINLIMGVGLLFAHLSNMGAINAILKFLPFFKGNDDQKQGFLLLNVLFVFGGILLFSTFAIFMQDGIVEFYSEKSGLFVDYYFWVIPVGIANVFFLVFESYLRAIYKNLLAVFLYEFVLRFFITVLLLCMWMNWINFNEFLIIHTLIYFIPSVVLLIYLLRTNELRFQRTTFKISKKFKKIIFSYSLFSYTNSIGILIVATMDALMIAHYEGLAMTGVYTTVIYLVSALQIPFKALTRISGPLIPQYWKEKNMLEMKQLYVKVSSISLIIALYLFLLVWINREALFSFLPEEFQAGIWVFFFLMMGRLVDMYTGLNGFIFITSKKYKYDIIFTIVLIFGVYYLNKFLIPLYGITGAAISTGLVFVIYNIGRVIFIAGFYKIHPFEIKQLWVILLFLGVFTLGEFYPLPLDNRYWNIGATSFGISLLFLVPIYLFRWNQDLNLYISNVYQVLQQKLKK